jgi:hypothetical protein
MISTSTTLTHPIALAEVVVEEEALDGEFSS